jgi:predicted transcriptional regulator of viral defense system
MTTGQESLAASGPDRDAFTKAVRRAGVRSESADQLPLTPVFRLRDAGLSASTLYRLVAVGAVERVRHGLYRRADAPDTDLDLAEAAVRAPDATVCLLSALAWHGLVTTIPSQWDLALPRGRTPVTTSPAVRWHRLDPDTFDLGRDVVPIEGSIVTVGLYSAERSIVDAFRLRQSVSHEIAVEALREWLPRRGAAPAALLRIAAQMPRATGPLSAALAVLL